MRFCEAHRRRAAAKKARGVGAREREALQSGRGSGRGLARPTSCRKSELLHTVAAATILSFVAFVLPLLPEDLSLSLSACLFSLLLCLSLSACNLLWLWLRLRLCSVRRCLRCSLKFSVASNKRRRKNASSRRKRTRRRRGRRSSSRRTNTHSLTRSLAIFIFIFTF